MTLTSLPQHDQQQARQDTKKGFYRKDLENIFCILVLCCAIRSICIIHSLLVLVRNTSTQAVYSIVGPEFLEILTAKHSPY